MKQGLIYCFSNPCMQAYYIGSTRLTIGQSLKDLFTESVPLPFQCEFYMSDEDVKKKKKLIYKELDQYRVDKNKNFFVCDLQIIRQCFESFSKLNQMIKQLNETTD